MNLFHMGLMSMSVWMRVFVLNMNHFLYPVQPDLLFEYYKSEIVESNGVVTKNFDLNQILVLFDIKRLVNFAPTILPRLLVHVDIIFMPMTSILVHSKYIHFLSNWAQLFDKLKQALTGALLAK